MEKNSSIVGKYVKINNGASEWMKERGFFDGIPSSIDGMIGIIVNDYTSYSGDDSHFEVRIEEMSDLGWSGIGVHPDFISILNS